MVLHILTGYWVLGIVYLDQLKGARHSHISNHDKNIKLGLQRHKLGAWKKLKKFQEKLGTLGWGIQTSNDKHCGELQSTGLAMIIKRKIENWQIYSQAYISMVW